MAFGRMATAARLQAAGMEDITKAIVPIVWWTVFEYGLTLVTVCAPAVFHLGTRLRHRGFNALMSRGDDGSESVATRSSAVQKLRFRYRRMTTPAQPVDTEKIVVPQPDTEKIPVTTTTATDGLIQADGDEEQGGISRAGRQYISHGGQRKMTFEEALRMS